ncbi:glutamate receptor 2.8-like [Rhodamnia argentea]|uniref:Glutamate receptor 2.8-like n=1 Tax=Rhodamnia argentea TaxID=178133 RepID=A0ABM3H9V2_9MYRT|nr:glutamate receptor 2.8-like [Rhodamnia argentea]
MTPSRSSFDAEKLLFLALSFFVIVETFRGGPHAAMAQSSNNNNNVTTIPVNVGVVLDLDKWEGQMELSCINMSLSDFYTSNPSYKTRLVLNVRNSKRDEVDAAAAVYAFSNKNFHYLSLFWFTIAALDLINNKQVQAIIGPGSSAQADFIIDLGNRSHVPIISFSATSPSLSSIRSPYFIRATQNDSSQVNAISAVVQAFGWKEAVLIYVDNEFGQGIIPSLTDALEEVNARVPYRSVIRPSAPDDQILEELYKLMTMQTRVFIVHMSPTLGSRLFAKAKEVGMMSRGYVWILTNGITDLLNLVDSSVVASSMQGVLGIKTYVPDTPNLDNFMVRWKMKFQQDNPSILNPTLNIFGYWAYDATRALAIAVEEIGAMNFTFRMVNSLIDATDLNSLGVSQNGQKLLQGLANMTLAGLTGNFSLVNGQLESSAFQIININGNAARGIGFWTPESGLLSDLNSINTSKYSTLKSNLGSIIWPGDSTSIPKGWEIPTNGKKLKILVPVKYGFKEFVTVIQDPSTNTSQVTGYCIEIFKAVVEKLPYAVPYDLIPFALPNGTSAGSYDDMIDQVIYQNYDALVGDTTIIANRSLYVDFTLPYTESGVAMLVPYKDNKSKNAWVFLKPLTWDLWLTTGCFFVFIALVVWILEHRINEDFRGPAAHQVGTSFWFSFSTMVFAQRESVFSNLARFVVVVWVFVVLILTQSYTASLSSLLVVQNLQPTVADVNQLLKSGERVGYLDGSFVHEMLKQMKFDHSRLVPYHSAEECDALLSNGSAKGGIAAAFDEVPNIKLVLSQYCNKYTMIRTSNTAGFGFVFPKGSPLVPDISRAILNVTEGPEMMEIENAWLTSKTNCLDSTTSVSSNSLGLDSFVGLFLIAGAAAVFALLIFIVLFVTRNWHDVASSSDSLWGKIVALGRRFHQRDLNSHTFKKGRFRDRSRVDGANEIGAVEIIENTDFPHSPSSQIDTDLTNEQGTPSAEQRLPNQVEEGCPEVVINVELTSVNLER